MVSRVQGLARRSCKRRGKRERSGSDFEHVQGAVRKLLRLSLLARLEGRPCLGHVGARLGRGTCVVGQHSSRLPETPRECAVHGSQPSELPTGLGARAMQLAPLRTLQFHFDTEAAATWVMRDLVVRQPTAPPWLHQRPPAVRWAETHGDRVEQRHLGHDQPHSPGPERVHADDPPRRLPSRRPPLAGPRRQLRGERGEK